MKPDAPIKTWRFTMVLTPDERKMLEEVADADRRTMADWVRVRVYEAHEKLTAARKAAKR